MEGFTCPTGKILFDKKETFAVEMVIEPIDFFQSKYYNLFYKNSLLTSPPAPPTFLYYGNSDMNDFFSAYNSIYCIVDTYNVTTFTGTTKPVTASFEYAAANTSTFPPYTYSWDNITSYAGGPTYPLNETLTYSDKLSASTTFTETSPYTKQYVQCTVTDSRGWKGYSRAVLLNFI